MSGKSYPVPPSFKEQAHIDLAKYQELYAWSVENPESFWAEQGRRIDWINPFTRVKNTSFGPSSVSIKWFEDGTTNVAQNCIDRHLPRLANHCAIIWEGDEPGGSKQITYQELHDEVCRLANVLKDLGVGRGDTVTIYLPMIPEAVYAMLACARIGAIHTV
ncbi:MAG TPA: acetyl-coenzyme A synthetase N-terminal domain-containing protein, partial [Methylocella sp.]|nr:acetyl-coenzyme A synthetase N-terminal domain-containing protein [Methylocella sp.]